MTGRSITDVLLERYLARDLDPALLASVEERLARSEPDRLRLQELQADSAAFLAAHPPGQVVARIEQRARSRRVWRLAIPGVLLAGLAAGVMLIVHGLPPVDQSAIRLAIHAAAEPGGKVGPVQVATAGDAVRFVLTGRAMGYVAVVGRTPDGAVQVYVPREGTEAERYDPAQPMLPGVSELQAGEGREEIIGIFSPARFDLPPVLEALRAGKPLDGLLPEGSVTATVPLKKR